MTNRISICQEPHTDHGLRVSYYVFLYYVYLILSKCILMPVQSKSKYFFLLFFLHFQECRMNHFCLNTHLWMITNHRVIGRHAWNWFMIWLDYGRYGDESKVVLSDGCGAEGRLLSCSLKCPCMFTVLSQTEDNLFWGSTCFCFSVWELEEEEKVFAEHWIKLWINIHHDH